MHRPKATWCVALAAILIALACGESPAARGQQPLGASLAPYLDGDELAVFHVDLDRADGPALVAYGGQLSAVLGALGIPGWSDAVNQIGQLNAVASGTPLSPTLTMAQMFSGPWIQSLRAVGCHELFLVVHPGDFFLGGPPFVVAPLGDGANVAAVSGLIFSGSASGPAESPANQPTSFFQWSAARKVGAAVIAGGEATFTRLGSLTPVARPDLTEALDAANDSPVQLVFVLNADQRRVIREMLSVKFPLMTIDDLGRRVADDMKWLSFGADPAGQIVTHGFARANDAAGAARLRELVDELLAVPGQFARLRDKYPDIPAMLQSLSPQVDGDRLSLSVDRAQQAKLVEAAVVVPLLAERELAARRACVDQMTKIVAAMGAYSEKEMTLPPPAIYDPQGRPLLSWRVALLPYLDEGQLYAQFHLDEPWDSEHNRPLVARMPALFACPALPLQSEGKTTYVVPRHAESVFPGPGGVPWSDIGVEAATGTWDAIALLEAAPDRAVVWTKPEDLNVDLENPLTGLGGEHGDVFLLVRVDATPGMFSLDVDRKVIRGMLTRVGNDSYR